MITVFTPSFADEGNTNAQNLTVKEVVARMDPARFRVIMLTFEKVDPRIAARPNTEVIQWEKRGNTARILWRLLRDVPDVYFFPREGPLDAAFFSARSRLRWKSALVTYIVTGGLTPESDRPLLMRSIRDGDVVAANSRHMARVTEVLGGNDVQIVYDGVDRRYYFPPSSPRDRVGRIRVLYAGSFRPAKRADMVVRAAALHPECEFRLAGIGEELENCRKLARDLKCANVVFLGHLDAAGLGSEMRQAHIFFFPSEIEGHPQVLVQAAACGLACVARVSYEPDFVVDGITGRLASSEQDIYESLTSLIAQPELVTKMAEAAAAHSRQYDWDRIAEQWQQLMESAVTRRRAGRRSHVA